MAQKYRYVNLDVAGALLLAVLSVSGVSLYTKFAHEAAVAADEKMAAVAVTEVAEPAKDPAGAEPSYTKSEPYDSRFAEAIATPQNLPPVQTAEKEEPVFERMIIKPNLDFDLALALYSSGKAEIQKVNNEPAPRTPAPPAFKELPRKEIRRAPAAVEKPWEQMTIEEKNALSEKLGGKICPEVKGRPAWAAQWMINVWLNSLKNVEELKASIKKNCGRAAAGVKNGVNPFLSNQAERG